MRERRDAEATWTGNRRYSMTVSPHTSYYNHYRKEVVPES
jgi:hypothetical protein